MVELYFICQSDNGTIRNDHAIRRWSNNYMRSLEDLKDPRAVTRMQPMFAAAGLVDIESRMIPLPLYPWSSGKI